MESPVSLASRQTMLSPNGRLREPVYSNETQPDIFPEERKGWKGYVEWEKYPEKKEKAIKLLQMYNFQQVRHAELLV